MRDIIERRLQDLREQLPTMETAIKQMQANVNAVQGGIQTLEQILIADNAGSEPDKKAE
jgi:hypothetical protein